AADVVDDLAEVPEEEVLIPAGKRTKRFRDQDAPPRAGAAGDADGARGAGAGKPGLKPIWWIIPSVSVLALIVIIIVIVSQSGGDAGTPRTNEALVLVNKPPPAPPQNNDNVP